VSIDGSDDDLDLQAAAMDMADLFERSVRLRAIMAAARRSGDTFQQALLKWADPYDLTAEMGYEIYEARARMARCPNCHTKEDEVFDKHGDPLPEGLWKIYVHQCLVCDEIASASKTLRAEDRAAGDHVRVAPRQPGEIFDQVRGVSG
jgi:hypothetical protein